jgi:hypothetical protein
VWLFAGNGLGSGFDQLDGQDDRGGEIPRRPRLAWQYACHAEMDQHRQPQRDGPRTERLTHHHEDTPPVLDGMRNVERSPDPSIGSGRSGIERLSGWEGRGASVIDCDVGVGHASAVVDGSLGQQGRRGRNWNRVLRIRRSQLGQRRPDREAVSVWQMTEMKRSVKRAFERDRG